MPVKKNALMKTKIYIRTAPIFRDKENWLQEMYDNGFRLVAITLHCIANATYYYFERDEEEIKKIRSKK